MATDFPKLISYENHQRFVFQVSKFDRYALLALHTHCSSRSADARSLPLLRIRTSIPSPVIQSKIDSVFVEAEGEKVGSLIGAFDVPFLAAPDDFADFDRSMQSYA